MMPKVSRNIRQPSALGTTEGSSGAACETSKGDNTVESIIVEDGIIIEHMCGKTVSEGAIEVPDGFPGYIGMKFDALLPDLSGVKPLSQQVKEGIFTVPDGYKITSDDIDVIRMDQEEINAVFPPEVWAVPGEFTSVSVPKTFNRDGAFGYFPPEDAVKMEGEQPATCYRAESDGTWVPDVERAKQQKIDDLNTQQSDISKNISECAASGNIYSKKAYEQIYKNNDSLYGQINRAESVDELNSITILKPSPENIWEMASGLVNGSKN